LLPSLNDLGIEAIAWALAPNTMPPSNERSAWMITLAAAAILMVTMGARQSLGLFISPLQSSPGHYQPGAEYRFVLTDVTHKDMAFVNMVISPSD
jgi:hypothetical protein